MEAKNGVLKPNLRIKIVWVRKEYLQDGQSGHGEFVEGHWVTAKSMPGRAFYFETYLPEYGALYDKLPISALYPTLKSQSWILVFKRPAIFGIA